MSNRHTAEPPTPPPTSADEPKSRRKSKPAQKAAKTDDTRSAKAAPAFYTVPQLAERWALSAREIRRFVQAETLSATRFGRAVRISAAAVARFETERSGDD